MLEGVFGAQRRLEAVFDQGDVALFLQVLNTTELFGHGEEFGGHLAGVHQQYGPTVDTSSKV